MFKNYTRIIMRYVNLFILFAININTIAQTGITLFDNSKVHEIRIEIDTIGWNDILENWHYEYRGSDSLLEHRYLSANVIIDGAKIENIGVRFKGASSFSWEDKRPFMLDFNEFVKGQEYEGLKKVNLLNSRPDHSMMRNMLAYDIFRFEGLVAPRLSYTNLYINNYLYGVYQVVEHIGKPFLKQHFGNSKGNLYKSGFSKERTGIEAYDRFILKTNEFENDRSRLEAFWHLFDVKEESSEQISEFLELDDYLTILAIDRIIQNIDTYNTSGGFNFYLYDDPETDLFHWLPWDYDFSFKPAWGAYNINENIFYYQEPTPELHLKYIETCKRILAENFTEERLFPLIDYYQSLLYSSIDIDPFITYDVSTWKSALDINVTALKIPRHRDIILLDSVCNNAPSIDSCIATLPNYSVLDTSVIQNEEVVFSVIIYEDEAVETEYSGLKSFISNRVSEVQNELDSVEIIVDDSSVNSLIISSEFDIFSNSSQDYLTVLGNDSFSINMFDVNGRLLETLSNKNVFTIEHLPSGLYIVVYYSNKGNQVFKFIKH